MGGCRMRGSWSDGWRLKVRIDSKWQIVWLIVKGETDRGRAWQREKWERCTGRINRWWIDDTMADRGGITWTNEKHYYCNLPSESIRSWWQTLSSSCGLLEWPYLSFIIGLNWNLNHNRLAALFLRFFMATFPLEMQMHIIYYKTVNRRTKLR